MAFIDFKDSPLIRNNHQKCKYAVFFHLRNGHTREAIHIHSINYLLRISFDNIKSQTVTWWDYLEQWSGQFFSSIILHNFWMYMYMHVYMYLKKKSIFVRAHFLSKIYLLAAFIASKPNAWLKSTFKCCDHEMLCILQQNRFVS